MNLPRLLRETFPYLPEAGPVTREQRKIINAAADRIPSRAADTGATIWLEP